MAKPEIRLKGFEGVWKAILFSDSFSFLKNNSLSRAELSENGKVKNVHYGDVLIKFGDILDVTKEQLPYVKDNNLGIALAKERSLENGDIIFADAAEDNTVGKCVEILGLTVNDKVISGLHTIPCRPSIDFEKGYLGYYLNSCKFHDQLLPHIQGTKVSSISKRAIESTSVFCPQDSKEQKGIADYFKSLDSMIQATTKKIASLKQMKSASLISMFPQAGESTPRIRFKGFEGEWRLFSISDLLVERNEQSPKSDEFPLKAFIANLGVADKGERYDRSALVNDVDNKLYKKTYKGDFIYSSNNLETGSIGLNNYGKATISPVYSIFYCTDLADPNFIGYRLVRKDFIREMVKWRQGVMYGQWRIHESDFLKISIIAPSVEEQKKIGGYFKSLDKQISLQEQRLEKLKQIKAACLDKMFV